MYAINGKNLMNKLASSRLTNWIMFRGFATQITEGVTVYGEIKPGYDSILTHDALKFVSELHKKFEPTRQYLLCERVKRQNLIDAGENLKFAVGNHDDKWKVAPVPADLQCRHCEITGPVERKMIINALNSGADVFMADFEDSLSPTWNNIIEGHINLRDANLKTIEFLNPDGSTRKLKEKIAQLLVRTRGWHLDEKHVHVDGKPVSGGLIDFALYFFHNIHNRLENNSSTYFYLPKMEHHLECRLWNDIFEFSEKYLCIPTGKIRATIMVETFPAAYEMEEMLYELRNYACGMNAGRWDYIFSIIKTLKSRDDCIMPDRKQVEEGYDGTWVAHPDLVKLAKDIFMKGLNAKDNQKERAPFDKIITENDLSTIVIDGGKVTEEGVRVNVSIGLQYLNSWFRGHGAAAINNLMEDAATAEISRAQLWQWLHHSTKLDDGRTLTEALFKTVLSEEVEKLGGRENESFFSAAEIVEKLVVSNDFETFLTIPGYDCLVGSLKR
ncbi:malate synthase-like isoform X3 [Hydractinia symbiolongicarpus]|uniref:malate synthase-like isoform X3 n=1 Tax=Hydractinia symbiolongicarpus TaxID=13093 RepID=UPI00254F7D63|nr:malate synthase-like isoform X3 [Hydractinia symbiolongicarpus]